MMMKFGFMKSLKFRVNAIVCLLVLIGLISISMVSYFQAKSTVNNDIEQISKAKVEKLAFIVNEKIRDLNDRIEILSNNGTVKSMDWPEIKEYLAKQSTMIDGFYMVLVADKDGNYHSTTNAMANIKDRAYFKSAIQGEASISEPVISKSTGKPIFAIAAPIRNNAGSIVGVVAGTVNLDSLTAMINQEKLGESGYAFMINNTGLSLAAPDPKDVMKKNFLQSDNQGEAEIARNMVTGKDQIGYFVSDGKEKMVAYTPIESTAWSVGMVADTSELRGSIDKLRTSAIWITIMVLLIIFAVLWLTLKKSLDPLAKLAEASKKLAVGDLEVNVKVENDDEIGAVSAAFAAMIENTREQAAVANKIAEGDLNLQIEAKSANDILSKSLKLVAENLQAMVSEVQELIAAATDGKLDARGDEARFKGAYRQVVLGINSTLDTIVLPVSEARQVLGRMALNDYTQEMTGEYKGMLKQFANEINMVRTRLLSIQDACERVANGDSSRLEEFRKIGKRSENDKMMPSVTRMMEVVRELISEVGILTNAAIEGNLGVRGKVDKFEGEYQAIISGINNTLDAMAEPINASMKVLANLAVNDYSLNMDNKYKGIFSQFADAINDVYQRLLNVQRIMISMANGDISELESWKKIGKRSENDQLIPATVAMMSTIQDIISEFAMLTDAAAEGKLEIRGNTKKFKGCYYDIVGGMNNTLDVVSAPINEAKQVFGRMSLNDYTQEMTGEYKGLFKQFADEINMVRTRLLSVQDAFIRLAKGDNSRLEEFRKVGKRSENDKMMPSATKMMEAIQALIDEVQMLSNDAINGRLETRGNASAFEGEYAKVIQGFNSTLDAIVRPIQEAEAVLQEMANGNLQVAMQGDYKGDYKLIKDAINGSLKAFNEALGEINNAAEQVASGSRQVADSSQALSQGSTEQAASIEEVTASMEQMASQTKQSAVNASNANELALTAKVNALQGNEQMREMLNAMGDINQASASISKIIKVIDEIAFQTNILALNAAVEAARAGQHGKGFAVVAEEVRNLAARSANAAKETTALIEGSIRKVEHGTKIANDTAQALNGIVESVTQSVELVGQISEAANEQASGIAQVNQAIIQVSQVTQMNTATAEESAASSEELTSQAEVLKSMVGRFRLKRIEKGSFNVADPEVAKLIEEMIKKRDRSSEKFEAGQSIRQAAPTRSKIVLDDNEFGKY